MALEECRFYARFPDYDKPPVETRYWIVNADRNARGGHRPGHEASPMAAIPLTPQSPGFGCPNDTAQISEGLDAGEVGHFGALTPEQWAKVYRRHRRSSALAFSRRSQRRQLLSPSRTPKVWIDAGLRRRAVHDDCMKSKRRRDNARHECNDLVRLHMPQADYKSQFLAITPVWEVAHPYESNEAFAETHEYSAALSPYDSGNNIAPAFAYIKQMLFLFD